MAEAKPPEYKVILLGDTAVGKSSLVLRFVTGKYDPYSESTIGASFMSKPLTVNGKLIKFQIWDTAGQEKYHSLAPMYYREAAAAILVYDITRASTFKTLQNWVDELKSKGPKDIVLVIAGNKADLEDSREVEYTEAENYAKEMNAVYVETSSKEDTNVQEIFMKIGAKRLRSLQASDPSVVNIRTDNKPAAKGGCC